MRTVTVSPGAIDAESFTNGFVANDSTIDALTTGGGESTTVDDVVVGAALVVVDEEIVVEVDEEDVVDVDVVDDVSGLTATVVVVVVVVVVDVATCMKPSSAATTIRSPDALNPMPVHASSGAGSASHVAPASRET
jgi:hypothetical protein